MKDERREVKSIHDLVLEDFDAYPSWARPRQSRSTLRFISADHLGSLLAASGLRIAEQYGDWNGERLMTTSPEIITVARCDG